MNVSDWTHRRLQEVFGACVADEVVLNVDGARLIIFSDHHKGQRDGADDFRRCERAYNAALGYYYESGHKLVDLGDVEELWECRPKHVMAAYGYTLRLEADFYKDDRYLRISGNHDDEWESAGSVKRYLGKIFPGIQVQEGTRFKVVRGDDELGTLFLVHGHQGTTFSDRHRWIGKFIVRTFWRPIQRLLRKPSTTPAADFALREKHDLTMYDWARRQEKLVLIAGHTHRPVFMGSSHHAQIEKDLQTASPDEAPALRAKLEWVKAQGDGNPDLTRIPVGDVRCCYFNTGCCSFGDGDITGLEIVDGSIRLIRWPGDGGTPQPQLLATADLAEEVFAAL
ncbi:MAG TPA: metallophosphoesterase [Gemmatimonadota bacterium]|nr:metallophosphoesterase [Gemmatimonadota bacterium]